MPYNFLACNTIYDQVPYLYLKIPFSYTFSSFHFKSTRHIRYFMHVSMKNVGYSFRIYKIFYTLWRIYSLRNPSYYIIKSEHSNCCKRLALKSLLNPFQYDRIFISITHYAKALVILKLCIYVPFHFSFLGLFRFGHHLRHALHNFLLETLGCCVPHNFSARVDFILPITLHHATLY